ncbi:MAG: rhodanese-like domain-containing protein, partial [Candidatus Limnocylindrales bacterium]
MNQGPPIPAIDVAEADRRLREDSDRPLLVDVREDHEFADVRAPGAVFMPMSTKVSGYVMDPKGTHAFDGVDIAE